MSTKRFETGKLGETVIGGVDANDKPKHAIIDRTGAMAAMEYEHYTVHQSYHYFFTEAFSLANGVARTYLITTPTHVAGAAFAPSMHVHFKAEGSAITQFDIYEDTLKSATTTDTALTPVNSNRNTTDTAEMKIGLAASTTDSDGTLIFTFKGGAAAQQSRTGDSGVSAEEIILKKNAKYLARFTSFTDANLCDFYLLWYEQQP